MVKKSEGPPIQRGSLENKSVPEVTQEEPIKRDGNEGIPKEKAHAPLLKEKSQKPSEKPVINKIQTRDELKFLDDEAALVVVEIPEIEAILGQLANATPDQLKNPEFLTRIGEQLRPFVDGSSFTKETRLAARKIIGNIIDKVPRLLGVNMDERSDRQTSQGKQAQEYVQRLMGIESGMMMAASPTFGSNWMDVEVPTVNGQPAFIRQEIRDIESNLRKQKGPLHPQLINDCYENLSSLQNLTAPEIEYVKRLQERIKKVFDSLEGNRRNISPEEYNKLTRGPNAEKEREVAFYRQIRKVLENPNEETHKQLNLYDLSALDNLMEVFRDSTIEEIDPHTGSTITKSVGQEVIGHYQNLLDTIRGLSDAEYWARHSAGDVENLTKMISYFENKFATEAMSDPIVEDMIQCVELAIKFIRDNNDGYIPQELTRYDEKTHRTYVDDLAMKFFRQRMDGGGVRDYVRDNQSGIPVVDPSNDGKTYLRSDKAIHFSEMTEEEVNLRLLAALRMAKGVGIITNRTLELYAFTKVPSVDAKLEGGQRMAGFSSTAYEGLTRWINPLVHWFLKYGFGDTLFLPFFNSILQKGAGSAERNALNWTQGQYIEACNLAARGDISKIEAKFGPGSARIVDMMDDFSFSGRFGPLSMWGLKDATIGWSARQFERLGGSARLIMVSSWVENQVKERFKEAHAAKRWNDTKMNDEWLKAKTKVNKNGSQNEWIQEIEQREQTYKTYIWTQHVLRNPLGVGAQITTNYESQSRTYRAKLRSKIFHDIFTEDDLKYLDLSDLSVERDLAATTTLTSQQKAIMERLTVIDGDLASVSRYAMNSEEYPRDIQESDFAACIKGDIFVKDKSGNNHRITESERRRHALSYWKEVQRAVFGKAVGDGGAGMDALELRSQLGLSTSLDVAGDEMLFAQTKSINDILKKFTPNCLIHDALKDRIAVHVGTEDVQWSYLDINTLGDRHWNRRAGDFLTRARTIQLMMQYFNGLTGKPKVEDLVKLLGDIGRSEKNHDPKEAAKFVSIFATATMDIYRQRHLAGIPVIGRILPMFGIPMSIAQKAMGTESATFWSSNNLVKFADLLGAERVIPNKRILDGKDFGQYTMEEVRKNGGASKLAAASEMLIIGFILASFATGIGAITASTKEKE